MIELRQIIFNENISYSQPFLLLTQGSENEL